MGHYKSNVRDQVFNLFEVFGVDKALGDGKFADLDADTAGEMLNEIARLAEHFDALLDTLTKVRAELTGAEPTFSPEPISTFAVWGQALEGRDFVGLVIDRSLPSRRAFLMPPGSARDIGHELIRVARIASSAKAGG